MSNVSIKKIQFLTPAVVTYSIDGVTGGTVDVLVDLKNKTVNLPDYGPAEIASLFFPFLDDSLRIPADAFEADEEVYQEADNASQQFEKAQKEHVGESDV